ncbi:GAF and ANTAR domain-containing protein [Curtobacterium sp. 1P10AnD]|uniref:ANTAR domain-containing protein n=1 Tax=Curtobacterium sp. 1P10AnD TaxID=3132283 RepID=UPI0039A3C702
MAGNRDALLFDAFTGAAATIVEEYDVVELLQSLVDDVMAIFDVDAAAIMLLDPRGELELAVSTNERTSFVGFLQLEDGEGPCIEAHVDGVVVRADDLAAIRRRWPRFAAAADRVGFASVHSIPLRVAGTALGSMNLFRAAPGGLDDADASAVQALTNVATIGILQQRTADSAARVEQQLQQALDSRIVIEQAKGFIAHTLDVDMDTAFAVLRSHARSNQRLLAETARAIVQRELPVPRPAPR